MLAKFLTFLMGILIDGVSEYGKWAVFAFLIWVSSSYLKALAFRVKDFFAGKHAENSSHNVNTQNISRKTVTGSSKRECAQSAYKTAAGYWNEKKDAYSAYVWLSLAVMLGIKDGEAKSFRQTVSSFDDTLRKNLSVQQVKAAVEEAQNMSGSVRIQSGRPQSKHSGKPADTKRTLQERIARNLVKAVKSAKHNSTFTFMRKVLRSSSRTKDSKNSRKK